MALNIISKPAKNFKRYGEKKTGVKNGQPDSIEIHSIGTAQDEALVIINNMNQVSPSGIVNAIVDAKLADTVYEILPDTNVTWADAGYGNNHSFTIEMAESDYMKYTGVAANYTITNKDKFLADINRAYSTYVQYVAKKCKDFGIDPLDKLSNGLYKVYSHKEAAAKKLASNHADPDHVWSAIGKNMDAFRKEVKALIGVSSGPVSYKEGMTKEEFISSVGSIAQRLSAKTGILPSVVTAQACLESGYGLGTDAIELTKRNNILGMKSELINSTWKEYSVWPSESYRKRTPEVYNGNRTYIYDNFRVYESFDQCLEDYEMFLLHVKNDKGLKYADVAGLTDPKQVITIISQRGYATDPSYISKVMKIIEENNLTKFDAGLVYVPSTATSEEKDVYFVKDSTGRQLNSFHVLENAKKEADSNPGSSVYDGDGVIIYPVKKVSYFVRTPDGKQRNAFISYENAVNDAKANPGYNVYDGNGNVLYSSVASTGSGTSVNKTPKWVGKVTTKNGLNVRSGPSTSYNNIKEYPIISYGNLVDVCDETGNWYYVRIAGKYYGYVSKTFIAKA